MLCFVLHECCHWLNWPCHHLSRSILGYGPLEIFFDLWHSYVNLKQKIFHLCPCWTRRRWQRPILLPRSPTWSFVRMRSLEIDKHIVFSPWNFPPVVKLTILERVSFKVRTFVSHSSHEAGFSECSGISMKRLHIHFWWSSDSSGCDRDPVGSMKYFEIASSRMILLHKSVTEMHCYFLFPALWLLYHCKFMRLVMRWDAAHSTPL